MTFTGSVHLHLCRWDLKKRREKQRKSLEPNEKHTLSLSFILISVARMLLVYFLVG